MTVSASDNQNFASVSVAELIEAIDAEIVSLESLLRIARDELAVHLKVDVDDVPDVPAPMSARTARESARTAAVRKLMGARLRRTTYSLRRSRDDVLEIIDRIVQHNQKMDDLSDWERLLHFRAHRNRAADLAAKRERKLSAFKRARQSIGDMLTWLKQPNQAALLAQTEREMFEENMGKRNRYKLALLRYRLLREELNHRAHIRSMLTDMPEALSIPVSSHDLDELLNDGTLEQAIRAVRQEKSV